MRMKNKEITAMDCWHYIAPLIPVNRDQLSIDIYVKTFDAFQLLKEKEKQEHDKGTDT